MSKHRNTSPWVVLVAMAADTETPEEAVGLVQAELAARSPSEDQPWQTEAHYLLPRPGGRRERRVAARPARRAGGVR